MTARPCELLTENERALVVLAVESLTALQPPTSQRLIGNNEQTGSQVACMEPFTHLHLFYHPGSNLETHPRLSLAQPGGNVIRRRSRPYSAVIVPRQSPRTAVLCLSSRNPEVLIAINKQETQACAVLPGWTACAPPVDLLGGRSEMSPHSQTQENKKAFMWVSLNPSPFFFFFLYL